MNIPESWLRTFCNPKLPGRELADKLTMMGIEVEAYDAAVCDGEAGRLRDRIVEDVAGNERE